VTTPLPRKRRDGVRIHRSETLENCDRALERNVPVTSVARTALDLAVVLRFRNLRRLIRRSEELRVFDLADFRSVLARNRGHRGRFALECALAVYEPPRFTRSELEREFLGLVEQAGLPRAITAFNVAGYELDVYWPDLRFAVELDVYATHGAHEPFEEDRRRDCRGGCRRSRHSASPPGSGGQAVQGRRERGVLCTRATEDAEMRRATATGWAGGGR
jgi:hypothetical protein